MIDASVDTAYLLFGGAGLISLVAFVGLILVPALSSFGRPWEKAGAGVLSVFLLITLVLIGIGAGAIAVYLFGDSISTTLDF